MCRFRLISQECILRAQVYELSIQLQDRWVAPPDSLVRLSRSKPPSNAAAENTRGNKRAALALA